MQSVKPVDRTHKLVVELFTGEKRELFSTDSELKAHKNAQRFVSKTIPLHTIERIVAFIERGESTYESVTYDHQLEGLRNSEERVVITYKWDDNSTEEIRCYVGKSTGWIPCYLEIKRSNSSGGGTLLVNSINKIQGLRRYRHAA